MNQSEAFLADIIAHPDDDTPRLIYADWLMENGEQEQGEFIRRSVESGMAFYPESADEPMPGLENVSVALWVGRRGFVESVTCPVRCFLRHAESIFRTHPVTAVVLSDREPLEFPNIDKPFAWRGAPPTSELAYPNDIPDVIAAHFPVGRRPDCNGIHAWWTRVEALADLSNACVLWGRQEAGLRIPPPPRLTPGSPAPG